MGIIFSAIFALPVTDCNLRLPCEDVDEGINASDPEMVGFKGKTYVYFSVGDQLRWMNVKRAVYPGKMAEFLRSWYVSPGIPDWGTAAGEAMK